MNSRNRIFLVGQLILLSNIIAFSQSNDKERVSMILDIAGSSGFYSLSGEYLVTSQEKYAINTHVGFGYFPIKNTSFISVPVGFNAIIGSGKHHLEMGLGLSYIQGLRFVTVELQGAGFTPTQSHNELRYYPQRALYYAPTIGYRFDKMGKGFIFKLYYSPMIVAKDFFNMDTFLDEAIPDNYWIGNFTKKEYYDHMFVGENYPTAENDLIYLGLSIGYRF